MNYNFQFSNLCGTVYKKGNIIFSPDGNGLYSPVGNKISFFNLVNNSSFTFPIQMEFDIVRLAIHPQGHFLLAGDIKGNYSLINPYRRVEIDKILLPGGKPSFISFSPNGNFFAISTQNQVHIYQTPSGKEFTAFKRLVSSPIPKTLLLSWDRASTRLICSSVDLCVRVFDFLKDEMATLSGFKSKVIGAFFSKDDSKIYCVQKRGGVDIYEESKQKGVPWSLEQQHSLKYTVSACDFQKNGEMLILGSRTGSFSLYLLPQMDLVHSLSISDKSISTCAINPTGDWIAFGSSDLGQLLVWEWKSETQILKQQGHALGMTCLAYSSDGQYIATGGLDSKVKCWNVSNGFCFVTFSEHKGPITGIAFSPKNAVFSASLDGTVRAFDLLRYRNFRVLTTPTPTQFSSIALDPSGEIVVAASKTTSEIFVWDVQSSKILEILSGGQSVISSLVFNPIELKLVSAGWDGNIIIWDVFEGKGNRETLHHTNEILCVAFRSDGAELCVSTMDGILTFWNVKDGTVVQTIEGTRDLMGGKFLSEQRTAERSAYGKYFTTVCYSVDGTCVLAAGHSKWICLYQVEHAILLKKFLVSNNASLEGVRDYYTGPITDAGPTRLFDIYDPETNPDPYSFGYLPGASKSDLGKRKQLQMIRVEQIQFQPTGRSFAAVSTEGLVIFSLDETLIFDPLELDIEVTPSSILIALESKHFMKALTMSFKLNEQPMIQYTFEHIPLDQISLISREFPLSFLSPFLAFLAQQLPVSTHFHLILLWIKYLLVSHGTFLKENPSLLSQIRLLHESVSRHHSDISSMVNKNIYSLQYLLTASNLKSKN